MVFANDVSLKKFINYTNSIYDIVNLFKMVSRKNVNAKTQASTVLKMLFGSLICSYSSINEMIQVSNNSKLDLKMLFSPKEYVPKMHGFRDGIIDIDYNQIVSINESVIKKAKTNKAFQKNLIDGLTVMAWDGVELNETKKDIEDLPEREYKELDEIRKYIKYTAGMLIGPKFNLLISTGQHLETEIIKTKSGKERSKTIGETKLFEKLYKNVEKKIGRVIDVNVFDGLYLNQNVMNLINKSGSYFVIRLKDETRDIYEDAEGLFRNRDADSKYEIVEIITTRKIKYSKEAKKKDITKTKIKIEKRQITTEELGYKKKIKKRIIHKKNSTIEEIVFERVITRKEAWYDLFEIKGYQEKVKVVKSIEKNFNKKDQVLYVVTNMIDHDVETILKIMHARWNIENNGFRTLKQRFNIEHIFIGNNNAINVIVQMIFMVFNLLELYFKVRLKNKVETTWSVIVKIFERALHEDKEVRNIIINSS